MFTRTRYQQGCLTRKKSPRRGHDVWEFRYYDVDAHGRRRRRSVTVGTVADYPPSRLRAGHRLSRPFSCA